MGIGLCLRLVQLQIWGDIAIQSSSEGKYFLWWNWVINRHRYEFAFGYPQTRIRKEMKFSGTSTMRSPNEPADLNAVYITNRMKVMCPRKISLGFNVCCGAKMWSVQLYYRVWKGYNPQEYNFHGYWIRGTKWHKSCDFHETCQLSDKLIQQTKEYCITLHKLCWGVSDVISMS